jgi:Tetratricopeptide repeat
VLEGSVRRSGQKLRVTAQLIDVETGFHRYSQAYDREVKDIFDIQNEIAREIVNALKPKLGLVKDAKLIRQGTSDLEAYNLWLKAHEWLRNPNPVAVDAALAQLEQAVALDPEYIAAWGDLAYVHAHKSVWAGDPMPSLLEAYRAAAIALAREPANVPALLVHSYVGMLVHHDAAAAARYMAEAREGGGDPSVWAYNNALLHSGPLGDYESALAALQEAESRDPLAPNVRLAQIEMNLAAGRVADAVAVAEAAQPLLPGAPLLMLIAARAYIADGDIERAREHMEAARHAGVVNFPGFPLLRFAIDEAARDHADAGTLLEELLKKGVDGQANACYVIGEGYKAVGDYGGAIEWWSRAVERHEPWSLSFMPARNRNHPVIGKDPRFLALLRRMGLEEAPAASARPPT